MLVVQIKVFRSVKDVNSAREQAALALELGVNDEQSLFVLHPKIDRLRTIAAKASAENISIFAFYPYKDQRERLGTILQPDASSKRCEPSTLKVEALVKDSEFHRISFIAKSVLVNHFRTPLLETVHI